MGRLCAPATNFEKITSRLVARCKQTLPIVARQMGPWHNFSHRNQETPANCSANLSFLRIDHGPATQSGPS